MLTENPNFNISKITDLGELVLIRKKYANSHNPTELDSKSEERAISDWDGNPSLAVHPLDQMLTFAEPSGENLNNVKSEERAI